tara:strand:+ start:1194 stop:1502 length:309 start_codon:yes stop_codon:yes gene_type:complete
MRGTINFIVTANEAEYVFNKKDFKYMYILAGAGTTSNIYIEFQAENNLIDHDLITLTVTKQFASRIVKDISENINLNGHHEIKHSQSTGIYKHVTIMTYTAG